MGWADAKNGAANAHVRRSQLNRQTKIRTHSHRQIFDGVTFGNLRQKCKMGRDLCADWRNAHESIDREFEALPTPIDKGVGLFGQHACLLRLGAGIDLDE